MNADPPPAESALPDAPFVGPRPFDRGEAAIFLGRHRDAALLRDKVFSARLTVLYGPSGVGKSSIVRALLLSELESLGARTVYFDTWRGDDPLEMLKARLVEEAAALGIPNPGAGAPTLVELVRLVQSEDRRMIVVVLDQFEEFFTAQREKIVAFRKEAGQLVRAPGVDVRVLLSLREEHLAALEPLREEMLHLFQSTYRLEPLEEASVREAINGPIELFGGAIGAELVDQLVADVRQGMDPAPTGSSKTVAAADLPILQILCDELWKAARKAGSKPALTQTLYASLGGKAGILERYLKRVTPRRWRDRLVTAKLLRHLAPPDGHKVSFSVDYLASLTDLAPERVRAEVERLSKPEVGILRSRAYGQGKVLYELWHDSFIRIIGPWRDNVLRLARRLARAAKWSSVALAVAAVVWLVDQYELRRNTHDVMQSAHRTMEQKLVDVSEYLLLRRTDNARFTRLKELLQQPVYSTPSQQERKPEAAADAQGEWPFVLQYSTQRKLDEFAFAQAWSSYARQLGERGLPVPLQLRLEQVDHPRTYVALLDRGELLVEFDLPLVEERAYLNSAQLRGPSQEFFEHFRDEWQRIDWASGNWWPGAWWTVPRWSLPAWKASGVDVGEGSGLLAFRLARELQRAPEKILTPPVVEILLRHAARFRPTTVAEARKVRQVRLVADLQEIVRRGHTLLHLVQILDALAGLPEVPSAQAADAAILGIESARPPSAAKITGPHAAVPQLLKGRPSLSDALQHEAYRPVRQLLPDQAEVRIYLGAELASAWLEEGGTRWHSGPWAQIQAVRDATLRDFGIVLPDLHRPRSRVLLPPKAFRIEFLSQSHDDAAGAEISDGDLTQVGAILAAGARDFRLHFITAERIEQLLRQMNPFLRAWLEKRYSITDLKLLLRAASDVRRPTGDADASIRHAAWLLGSLVFWTQLERGQEIGPLGARLRMTQSARRAQAAVPPSFSPEILDHVEAGRSALWQGRLGEAQHRFQAALRADAGAAATAFLNSYHLDVSAHQIRTLHARCESFGQNQRFFLPRLSVLETAELDEISGEDFDALAGANARRLRLCLFGAKAGPTLEGADGAVLAIAKGYGRPESWPEEQAVWFGEQVLMRFDPTYDDRELERTAARFLRAGLPRLATKPALETVDRLGALCGRPGPKRWCWRLLAELAEADDRATVLARTAELLLATESTEDLKRSSTIAERAKVVGPMQVGEPAARGLLDRADYVIVAARVRLARQTPGASREHVARDLDAMLKLSNQGTPALVEFLDWTSESQPARAKQMLEHAFKKWGQSHGLLGVRLRLELTAGNREGAASTARLVRRLYLEGSKRDPELAFLAALGLIMTKAEYWEHAGRDFLGTDHEYAPYIAMLLYARMSGAGKEEAHELLRRRWSQALPNLWEPRLDEGDVTVWREMLIGHYMGAREVERYRIFDVLTDAQRFAESELRNVPLPRLAMLCEAYLYDAFLAASRKDPVRAKESLEKTVATGYSSYFEYSMAKYLLSQECGPDGCALQ